MMIQNNATLLKAQGVNGQRANAGGIIAAGSCDDLPNNSSYHLLFS
ncbi:hypothetical protein [Agarivorans litoreus]|nr:hypothetical protein [Agarivorans litoreus]